MCVFSFPRLFLCLCSLFLDVKVYCGPDSFGPMCSVTCRPRKDDSAGYKCDRLTGRKICLVGQFVIRVIYDQRVFDSKYFLTWNNQFCSIYEMCYANGLPVQSKATFRLVYLYRNYTSIVCDFQKILVIPSRPPPRPSSSLPLVFWYCIADAEIKVSFVENPKL